MVVYFRENASVAILAADIKRSFWAAWTVMNNCLFQFGLQCAQLKEIAIRRVVERQNYRCSSCWFRRCWFRRCWFRCCWFRRCWFRRCFVFRGWYRWGNVKRIAFVIFWITLETFVFARCGGYKKAPDFTRAGHRIVQSTILHSFFAASEAYMRGRLSDGFNTIKLHKTHFNCSRHK